MKTLRDCFVILLFAGFLAMTHSQLQPYQDSATAKYVKTTRFDTVSVPYVKGSKTNGIITNESASYDLKVWFAKKDSSVRDEKTYTFLKPGRSIKFSFYGRKIFRCSASDSVFSQVIFGDDISILSDKTIIPMDLSGYPARTELSDSLQYFARLNVTNTIGDILFEKEDQVIIGSMDNTVVFYSYGNTKLEIAESFVLLNIPLKNDAGIETDISPGAGSIKYLKILDSNGVTYWIKMESENP